MRQSGWRRLDACARDLVPVTTTLALVIAGRVPLGIPGLASVAPWLPMIAVFYWALNRPDLMPPTAAFAIGLAEDILSGAPIGANAAVFVLLHAGLETQRGFLLNKPFAILWFGFAVAALAAALLVWLATMAASLALIDGRAVLLQAMTTIGAFPIVFRLLWRCHVTVLRQG